MSLLNQTLDKLLFRARHRPGTWQQSNIGAGLMIQIRLSPATQKICLRLKKDDNYPTIGEWQTITTAFPEPVPEGVKPKPWNMRRYKYLWADWASPPKMLPLFDPPAPVEEQAA